MDKVLDRIIAYLKDRFGERTVTLFGFWASIIIVVAVVYSFFIKEVSHSFDLYYDLKLEKCKEVSKLVAQLATSRDPAILQMATVRFDELYYGELVLFEGRELESTMVNFRKQIASSEQKPSSGSREQNSTDDAATRKLQATRAIDYDTFLQNPAPTQLKLRRPALLVSIACYREVTPSLFGAMTDRLKPPREKLDSSEETGAQPTPGNSPQEQKNP
jgi:hypothetical protein